MNRVPDAPRFLDATIRIDKLPATGRDIEVVPDADERAAMAAFLELTAVEGLRATMTATPFRGGIRVTGRLVATIIQPSVVTFEPVVQAIDEPIERIFLPGAERTDRVVPGAEVFIDLDDDAPDPLEGPEADLSDLILETLALALDPYPRAPGETIADIGVELDDPPESPFAALGVLKPRDGGA